MTDPVKYSTNQGQGINPPAYPGDAGLDVFTADEIVCEPHSITQIPITVRIAPPPGTVFTFMTRSGTVKQGLFVLPTLIDEGYRGPLFLFVLNTTKERRQVKMGTRIAQVLLLPNLMQDRDIELVANLPPSVRGENGFNSSGGGIT